MTEKPKTETTTPVTPIPPAITPDALTLALRANPQFSRALARALFSLRRADPRALGGAGSSQTGEV
jgi:hypothetical protein